MAHPYQITCVSKAPQFGDAGILIAACGPKIISVNLQDGSVISQWPAEVKGSANDREENPGDEGPPGKKRKLDKPEAAAPSVIKLALSPDQLHAVAVTGDDKCIHVFEIAEKGALVELSQRSMPKRPCAILVTPDNQTILCGDKFGDVYSLPLLPKESVEVLEATGEVPKPEEPTPAKAYLPTANTLTVHSGRNRRALENQLKQKDLQAKTKGPLKFEHQLLLGHVSMLTDVKLATQEVDGHLRNFIITSDRDEHIRVSRGALQQAYVIERYCLGHSEFISKICVLPGSNVLVSGGGDDWLGAWDWTTGTSLGKCDVKGAISALQGETENQDGEDDEARVAVSGLWTVKELENGQSVVLAASEKVPAIFAVRASAAGLESSQVKTIELPGNPLDITTSGSSIIVSLGTSKSTSRRLRAYKLRIVDSQPTLEPDHELDERLQSVNSLEISSPPSEDLLYGIANLRKRGTEEEQDAA